MSKTSTLIKLAPNPEDEDGFGEDPTGSLGDQGTGDLEFYDDMAEDSAGGELEDMAYKGRSVSGPRTKLAAVDSRIDRIEQSLGSLAKSVNALARVSKALLEKDFGEEGEEDEQDPMEIEDEDEEALNLAKTNKSAGRTSKVAKDDAASSFGEKDDNAPGNRPYDQTSPGEDDTVIQGGPSAGPGPISKAEATYVTPAQLRSLINRGVREALADAGVSRITKSVAPGVGASSKLDKAERPVDMTKLQSDLKTRSFSEINKLRVELGDLPAGVI